MSNGFELENKSVRRHYGRVFVKSADPMKPVQLFVLFAGIWLAILFVCFGFGFLAGGRTSWGEFYRQEAEGSATVWGCLGFGFATLAAVGTVVILGVRAHSLPKGWAVLSALVSSVVSAVAPTLLMFRFCDLSGDAGLLVFVVPVWSTAASALAFLFITLGVVIVREKSAPNPATNGNRVHNR